MLYLSRDISADVNEFQAILEQPSKPRPTVARCLVPAFAGAVKDESFWL
jgi:hypothetical protein